MWCPNVTHLPEIVQKDIENGSLTPAQIDRRRKSAEKALANMVRHGEAVNTTLMIDCMYNKQDAERATIVKEKGRVKFLLPFTIYKLVTK